jgi:hypothetical protein
MQQDKLNAIRERLAVVYNAEDYQEWNVQQIAQLRMDAKRLLKELDYWQSIPHLDEKPEGWEYIDAATTAPNGWRWACNNMSRFGNIGYAHALIKQ